MAVSISKETRTPLYTIIWGAIVIHMIQAITITYDPLSIRAIDIHAISSLVPVEYIPASLVSSSILAFFGLIGSNSSWYLRLSLLLPQQAFIFLSVIGVVIAVVSGHYADGTVKPAMHIFNDQLWLVGYFVLHTVSIVKRAVSV